MDPQKLQTVVAIAAGCLGAVTGTVSLVISLLNWRKARPRLQVRIYQSDHWIDNKWVKLFPEDPKPMTQFNVRLRATNTGRESTAVAEPKYSLSYGDRRWTLGSHLMIADDPRVTHDDESARLCSSVLVPGRGVVNLYIQFCVPIAIREDVRATLHLLDGDGRIFRLPAMSSFLQYELPEVTPTQ